MKLIILAAGEGTRLRPYTKTVPKCMVQYNGKALIDYTIGMSKELSIDEIIVVTGYKNEVLEKHISPHNITIYHNHEFANSNMVCSLFCAIEEFNDDIIISYSDIIFKSDILKRLIESEEAASIIADRNWHSLWKLRMENPLDDAETLILDKFGYVINLGQKTEDHKQIQGQYIGLIKFKKEILTDIKNFYQNLDNNKLYDNRHKNNMFMTTFLQLLIDNKVCKVKAIPIEGGWIEIDSVADLEAYQKANITF